MPSLLHEALLELVRHNPPLISKLLELVGVAVPAFDRARVDDSALNEPLPVVRAADLVVLLERAGPVFGVVLEAQLRVDARKTFQWPAYAASVRARFECPVVVVVVTPSRKVARWAKQPIALGGASTFVPVVIGPAVIPLVADPEEAWRTPELSVLSTLAHAREGREPALALVAAAVHGLGALPEEQRSVYFGVLEQLLPGVLRKEFKMLADANGMIGPTQRAAFAEGETKGEAKALFEFLDARGLSVTDEQRSRIQSCSDGEVLRQWIRRAVTVTSVDELLAETK